MEQTVVSVDQVYYERYKGSLTKQLEDAVRKLSPKAKQAMYAAATKNSWDFNRRTWDHCPINAASKELGEDVKSIAVAAGVFDMSFEDVARFINAWDTAFNTMFDLIQMLLKVGLGSKPKTILEFIVPERHDNNAPELEAKLIKVVDEPVTGSARKVELIELSSELFPDAIEEAEKILVGV